MIENSSDGLGAQIRRLLEMLDGDLEKLYRAAHPFYVPRYTPVMKALAAGKPLSIKDIAEQSSVSHSAASQTVSRLKGHGLVALSPNVDRRSRQVVLTDEGRQLLPWLRKQWSATTRAAEALDQDLKYPLSEILNDAIKQLERRSFSARIDAYVNDAETETS